VSQKASWPLLGCGVGLRSQHYSDVVGPWPQVDWFEATTENYMDTGGKPLQILQKVREHYPVALHGVALSIGSVDPLNKRYLERWKTLIEKIDPVFVSDHICWSGMNREQLHDLLPLPFTEESLKLIVDRVHQIQDHLDRQILLENVSTYVTYKHSTMPEWEFIKQIALRSGCGLLLDINNVYVNAKNHNIDPHEYIQQIPAEKIGYIHMAGHTDQGNYLFDTHSRPVIEPVWDLYREALKLWGQKSTLIEWDEDIPQMSRLLEEAATAKKIYNDSPVEVLSESNDLKVTPQGVASGGPSLREVEQWMKSQVYESGDSLPLKSNFLNPQGGDPGEKRIGVYRGGYLARTQEALTEVYEALKHVMGDKAFHQLAEKYAAFHHSNTYNLSLKGEKLPEFLKTTSWIKGLPFLSDLACLEWRIAEAFHAYDFPRFNPQSLSGLGSGDWESLRLAFQPSVHLLESEWPVLDIWDARKTPVKEIKIDLVNQPQWVLIGRRQGAEVFCEPLQKTQFLILTHLIKGQSLGESFSRVVENGQDELNVDEWFAHWVQSGLIVQAESTHKTGCR